MTPSQAGRAFKSSVQVAKFAAVLDKAPGVRDLSVCIYAYKRERAHLWIVWRARKDNCVSALLAGGKVTGGFRKAAQIGVRELIAVAEAT